MTAALTDTELADMLRAEAEGVYTSEAAVELVLGSRLLWKVGQFIDVDPDGLYASIDWSALADALTEGTLGLSGGENRLLNVAASLGSGSGADLRDLPGVDDTNGLLVVQALAHSFGWHERGHVVVVDGSFGCPSVLGHAS